jgi:hypothetical protein
MCVNGISNIFAHAITFSTANRCSNTEPNCCAIGRPNSFTYSNSHGNTIRGTVCCAKRSANCNPNFDAYM